MQPMPPNISQNQVFEAFEPSAIRTPFILSSPHSGQFYPAEFLALSSLDLTDLRKLEDCFVDELWLSSIDIGVPFMRAMFARAYIDVNRESLELDPDMFHAPLPIREPANTSRLRAGLGAIPRNTGENLEIYKDKLTFHDALRRIDQFHRPFHSALARLLNRTFSDMNQYILLDCHSMPHIASNNFDIILGDRYGTSCKPEIMDQIQTAFQKHGFTVGRNDPYSGGYITQNYGLPHKNKHAVQIEINRALYMNESKYEKNDGFIVTQDRLRKVLQSLCAAQDFTTAETYPLAAE